ncbi:MAG: CopD family protein [Armatimonadota bacterium]|nr:CopD family protein [Armatimonadota bacterium]MDR7470123.1 CopD family protein [Armatimonadota bacterium]MDR7475728.1 CopD family protein [Armatimonadota bacterium]MDR7537914.1 CopD family protein [Armatimonadota bacterium]
MVRLILRLLPLLLMAGVWAASATPAAAHGLLERSDPPAGASLAEAPRRVVLRFTEPVDPKFSTAIVLDRDGRQVSRDAVISSDRRQLTLTLTALGQGVYTVKWRVLWPLDGHTTSNFFVFAVGEAAPAGATGAGVGAVETIRVVVRWVGFITALLLAGSAFFQMLVLQPGLTRLAAPEAGRTGAGATATLRRLTVFAAPLLLVSVAVEFAVQTRELLGVSLLRVLTDGMLWPLLGGTKPGWSALLRGAMAVLILLPNSPRGRILRAGAFLWVILFGAVAMAAGGPAALLRVGAPAVPVILSAHVYAVVVVMIALILPTIPGARVPDMHWVGAFAGPVLLAGVTMNAHAAGGGLLAVSADWLHLLAASLWVGGLPALLLVLRTTASGDRPALARTLVPRFSTVAAVSLGVLTITGLYATWLYVPALRAFTTTTYGRILLAKLLLVVPLVGLGAANRYLFRPRLFAGSGRSAPLHFFLRAVTGEIGLGAAILLAVAALTITPPSGVVLRAPAVQKPLTLAGLAEDVRVTLSITAARPGWNRFEAIPVDGTGRPIASAARIFLRLTKLDEDLDPVVIPLTHQGQGRYSAEDAALGLPGWWQVEVVVRRRGRMDVSTSFPLRLGDGPTATEPAAARLLQQAQEAMSRVRAWREVQQVTDGSGNLLVATFELVRPDRMRYRTSGGGEAILIGGDRYVRSGTGPWVRDTLEPPFGVEDYFQSYTRDAQSVVLGRRDRCADRWCRVVLWETPDRSAALAAWVGEGDRRMYRLMMVAEAHFMDSRLTGFDANLRIMPPE